MFLKHFQKSPNLGHLGSSSIRLIEINDKIMDMIGNLALLKKNDWELGYEH